MGSWSLNGAFTSVNDPDFQPIPTPEIGAFCNGKPVRQGYPGGTLRFPPLPSAALNELVTRYEANKNAQTSGNVPAQSGYGWRACSAFWHEPQFQGWDGPVANGVTVLVSRIGYY